MAAECTNQMYQMLCRREHNVVGASSRAAHVQEQQLRIKKLGYWLLAAFCVGSALLVSIHVSSRSIGEHWCGRAQCFRCNVTYTCA